MNEVSNKVFFQLVSPERLLFAAPVDMVIVPGTDGEFAVLANHAALVSTLRPGFVRVIDGGTLVKTIYVAEGFVHVDEDGCRVMADESVFLEDLDLEKLQETLAQAQTELERVHLEDARQALRSDIMILNSKIELLDRLKNLS